MCKNNKKQSDNRRIYFNDNIYIGRNKTAKNIFILSAVTIISISAMVVSSCKLREELFTVKGINVEYSPDEVLNSVINKKDDVSNYKESINKTVKVLPEENRNNKSYNDVSQAKRYERKFEEMSKNDKNKSISNEVNKEEIEKMLEKSEKKRELNENYKSLFKVNTYDILPSLSFKEKTQLLSVARHLSISDYDKIKEYLYAKDQEKGIVDAISMVKEKTPEDEYKTVKKIADKFIDMDKLDSYLAP
ncbi:hypothetical protein SAMN02745196_01497 [Clostridium collagenovorans DSM 3089]|uniref:Uncharacterized protein n=1 Tax=Clostridium collagenovorans DSM 3089 TaxID=1121306 RepID=A0A1M5W1T7_9CLOT|nr:hypothetical protein [Clostridium collagenovorans]SHH81476.1 hypothetical protein SAMN02745196_01497 [Clostridium collagenovorans DSM 3089]